MLTDIATAYLENRRLDVELLTRLGVKSLERGQGEWIAIPFVKNGRVVNHKYRRLDEKRFSQDADAEKCFWNVDALFDKTLADQPLVICEGEFDAISVMQSGSPRVVSVPDGAPNKPQGEYDRSQKYSFLTDDVLEALAKVESVVLAADADAPGQHLINDLASIIGLAKCKVVNFPKEQSSPKTGRNFSACNDFNDVLKNYGPGGVTKVLNLAKPYPVSGVFTLSQLPDEPVRAALEIGPKALRGKLLMRVGDFSVVTGVPGSGKSSWALDVACNMVENHNWRVAIGGFEDSAKSDLRRKLRSWKIGKLEKDMTQAEKDVADEWIESKFVFIIPDLEVEADLKWLKDRLDVVAKSYKCDLVLVDPWNELDHETPPGMSLTKYTGWAIKSLRKWAKARKCHVMVVAHPSKLQRNSKGEIPKVNLHDIADSAHWYNKPDIGVVIHRSRNPDLPFSTEVDIQKIKYAGIIGELSILEANFNRAGECFAYDEAPDEEEFLI